MSICYSTQYGHKKCALKCNSCFKSPPCTKGTEITCEECNRVFMGAHCYHNHIRTSIYSKSNVCSRLKLCTECSTCYNVKKTAHICGESYCRTCKCVMPTRHECYMPTKNVKKESKNGTLFVFYDFECYQNKTFEHDSSKFEHQVMLCVAQQSCIKCREVDDIQKTCLFCGNREHVFMNDNVIEQFMRYLGSLNDRFKQIKIIAHNGQKYDFSTIKPVC